MPSHAATERKARQLATKLGCPIEGDDFLLFCWHFGQYPVEDRPSLFTKDSQAGEVFRESYFRDLARRNTLSRDDEIPHSTTSVLRKCVLRG